MIVSVFSQERKISDLENCILCCEWIKKKKRTRSRKQERKRAHATLKLIKILSYFLPLDFLFFVSYAFPAFLVGYENIMHIAYSYVGLRECEVSL